MLREETSHRVMFLFYRHIISSHLPVLMADATAGVVDSIPWHPSCKLVSIRFCFSFFFFFFFYHSASLPRGLNEVGYSLSRVVSANNGVAAFQFGSIRERWWACRRVHTSRPPVSRLFGVHSVHPPFSFSLFFSCCFISSFSAGERHKHGTLPYAHCVTV